VTAATALLGAAGLGALLGVANALALRRAVCRLVAAAPAPGSLALGALGRNALTLAPVVLLAAGDAATLIAGLTAFLVARRVAVGRLAARLPAAARGGER
jgi:hypothetical protein